MAAPAVVGGIGKLGFFNTVPTHTTYQKIGTTLINVTICDNLTGLIETLLDWTLSGQVPESEIPPCNAMLVSSLFVKELNISQMWRLDNLGIRDPSEQKTKEEPHEVSIVQFLRVVKGLMKMDIFKLVYHGLTAIVGQF
ncbi:hypothetical protein AVEN_160989-1 [Araneus ventricosus]|uniref:Uncharacterized protein n=1 Tax=Araneus ventricosus TaxID=182803 RepID=A0A4Y2QVB0_ARAVE|nr:hypothetical protein AVEN_250194-1 [Araneus ventricosus]GBN67334.1 hypothetical protein AVEN_160989-1 [Araneus ventricosus]